MTEEQAAQLIAGIARLADAVERLVELKVAPRPSAVRPPAAAVRSGAVQAWDEAHRRNPA